MSSTRFESGVIGTLTVATSPALPGLSATLTGLFGIDGVEVGVDGDGSDLSFPVVMDEGAPGSYSVEFAVTGVGVYFARVKIGTVEMDPIVVRVVADGAPDGDVETDVYIDIAAVAPTDPASVTLSLKDRENTSVGVDLDGNQYAWPLAMSQVPGNTDCWFFEDVSFADGGDVTATLQGSTGPAWNDVLHIHEAPSTSATSFHGWTPDAAYDPADWIPIGKIRRRTGWASADASDATVRELRRLAIETFMEHTSRWFPAWEGTWHGLRGQGSRLYLPVPVLMPEDGGSVPVVRYVRPEGDQDGVEEIPFDEIVWRVRGMDSKQPYISRRYQPWLSEYDVVIDATFGSVDPKTSKLPEDVHSALIGLIRWHSLGYAVGVDDARDQSTANRTTSESVQGRSVTYHESAIGGGITGDRLVDDIIARLTIEPGPWGVRCGSPT